MAAQGGYQPPASPAPVSGPGALSQRTDGGPSQPVMVAPGGAYGDRQDMVDLQSSAPMAKSVDVSQSRGGGYASSPVQAPTPFTAGTQAPNEPLTSGIASGPGVGPEALNRNAASYRSLTNVLTSMVGNDQSGEVAAFLDYAQRNGW